MIGKIMKLDSEYWVEIRHGMIKLLFQLEVRGAVAARAIQEVVAKDEGIAGEVQVMIDELDELAYRGRAAGPGVSPYILMNGIEAIIAKHRTDDMVGD